MSDIAPATLADQAYQSLRRDIVRGALAPGQPLRMAPLCDRYGMGMSPLREALNRLQAERLVTCESLKGFRVAPLSPGEFADTTRTRILIETEALRLSIARGDAAWENALRAAAEALMAEAAAPAPALDRLEQCHHAFHRALIAGSGSRWLMDFFQKLYAESDRYRLQTLTGGSEGAGRDIEGEHRAILDAALRRDADAACALLSEHYRRTESYVAARLIAAPAPARPARRRGAA